ncbi:hypothetical protein [Egicoccus halophilus]|uniref:Uncharacterized protein n=1 Tax=Egicoccus halophilus TaxID=1670830 RepID=A0A8J3A9K8_9ACTN|nr:hypothetical protein [Egicoccus halophilus]GGI05601.1 hypothetical protein GCM10011354_14900 [Egicoccus halophilus]
MSAGDGRAWPPAATSDSGRLRRPDGADGVVADAYVDLLDDATHLAAVEQRVARRERAARAAEAATWVGTLRDLAERRLSVVVGARGERTYAGTLHGLSIDHLHLELPATGRVHLRLTAVRTVRAEPTVAVPVAAGDRPVPADATLADVVDVLVEEVTDVVFAVRDLRDPVRGRVLALGEDVVTLRLEGPRPATVYLPLAAVDAVVIA